MYSMDEGMQVAKLAATDIEAWLQSKPETLSVQNVEDEPRFQQIDVDLIWTTQNGSKKIEIKGDRLHKTRNFFFETHSNLEKGTPGCFLYTEADYVFYYESHPPPSLLAAHASDTELVCCLFKSMKGKLDKDISGE